MFSSQVHGGELGPYLAILSILAHDLRKSEHFIQKGNTCLLYN